MENQHNRPRKPVEPLDPRLIAIYRRVAGEFADEYIENFMFNHLRRVMKLDAEANQEDIKEALEDPLKCLQAFYGHYAFARRGKDREDLSRATLRALNKISKDNDFEEILKLDDGVILWDEFLKICEEDKRKPNENQNRGLLQGMLELAQEIYRDDNVGSIAGWLADNISETGTIEEDFERIVDIRGVGPKSTATFARDMVHIFGLERSLAPADKLLLQPIDRWLRLIVQYVIPEPNMENAADWIVAGKVSKYSRRARVSGLKFNMGTTYFGQKVVRNPDRFEDHIKRIIEEAIEESKAERGF